MSDVLLTHGYFLADDAAERAVMRPYPPLGILYLSAYLKSRGFTVDVFDSTFSSFDALARHIRTTRPPAVGIYANLVTRRTVVRLIQVCKAAGSLVIVGGPEPANYAEEYLSHGADVVVFGEGELTLERLLHDIRSGDLSQLREIRGIAFRAESGAVHRTSPATPIARLDDLPFPDRGALDIAAYIETWRRHHGRGSVSLITARGCPYSCTWCSHAVFGFTHRRRSPANVADELQLIVSTYRPDMVWYADDVFTMHPKWLRDYAVELKRRGLRVPFETISREDRLDEQTVATLKEMGCFRLWVGSESGSQDVLDAMERGTNAARTREMIRLLQHHGIEAGTFIMLGFEGEGLPDIEATVEHLCDAPPDRLLTTVAYPIKGTEYYRQVADRVRATHRWEEGSDRDLTITGRRSRRFYRHATRWMVSSVALEKERRATRRSYVRMARSFASAAVGRIGMLATQHEKES